MSSLASRFFVVALWWIYRAAASECQVVTRSCSSDSSCYSLKSVITGSYQRGTCNTQTARCECPDIDGYDVTTCLPDVNGCSMCQISGLAQLDASYPGFTGSSMYYCFNAIKSWDLVTNEIRAVGVYEGSSDHTTSSTIDVNLRTCSDSPDLSKPVILLLSSYEAVNWIISSDDADVLSQIDIYKVQVVAYKWETTTVSLQNGLSARNGTTVEYAYGAFAGGYGYGSDTGGGSTAKMLYQAPLVLGDFVYSFVGQYQATNIDVCVGNQHVAVMNASQVTSVTSIPLTSSPTTASPTTATPTIASPTAASPTTTTPTTASPTTARPTTAIPTTIPTTAVPTAPTLPPRATRRPTEGSESTTTVASNPPNSSESSERLNTFNLCAFIGVLVLSMLK